VRLVWAGTYEPGFSRNLKLARLLELSGTSVEIVREPVWPPDRVGLAAGGLARTALTASWRYPRLFARLLAHKAPDLYLVSYPGWFDMPFVWLVARVKRRRVLFDPFISLYDTMISDRRLHSDRSIRARVASWVDRLSLRLADFVIADTPSQLELYELLRRRTGVRGAVIPIGADDSLFTPRGDGEVDPRLVLFYGSLVPLQGVGTIVEAAALLEADGIRVTIIGDGQDRAALDDAIRRTGASVEHIGPLPLSEIPDRVAKAAVCLGIFGDSEKAGRVVPHKVYECLAMGRAVVTREGPAIRSLLREGELVTVPPADPSALAGAIRTLIADDELRARVAQDGLEAYRTRFHETSLAMLLADALAATVD